MFRLSETSSAWTAFLLVFAIGMGAGNAEAQQLPLSIDTVLPGVERYDETVPTPQEVTGHMIGTRHTRPAQVVRYFEAVADVSDRISLRSHGRTYEGRRLIHAIVTAPANQQNLQSIRQANRRLATDPSAVSENDIDDMPAIVSMGYSIHGDEASGTEAAILLLYHLAAGRGPEVEAALNDAVTIINPMLNPDGRDRFVDRANGNRGGTPTADPQDREHNQPWPEGRTNHYLFDLNRDWVPAQHPATKGRLAYFHNWKPQVHTDFHEMGSERTYFFMPAIQSRVNTNTPDQNQELIGEIAEYHADYLEQIGSLFYTEETYSDWYYGLGGTYPDINGGLGILFEQSSSRSLKQETSRGVLRYAFTVRNQFMTSLSTLTAATEMRTRLLGYQHDFFANREQALQDTETEAYVIGEQQPTRARALARLLDRHDVQMFGLGESVEAEGTSFQPDQAFVVPLDQPQGRFVKAALERTSSFPDSVFYDVSTWTLPLAFGVDYAPVSSAPDLGEQMEDPSYQSGSVVGGRSQYSYVLPWGRYFAPRALQRLHNKDIRPRVMTEPFEATVEGSSQPFGRGSIVIQVQQRGVPADTIHQVVQRIADADYVDVYAADQGLTPSGPDLGAASSNILDPPKVALLSGEETTAYNVGEVWHLLSEKMNVPISLVDLSGVEQADLERYNTMVLAGGEHDDLPAETVREWVEAGGTLIGIEDAVSWPLENELVELDERTLEVDSLVRNQPYADLDEAYGAQGIGGVILQADLDPTHPVAYGYDQTVPVFRVGTGFYDPSVEPGASVATYDSTSPRLSGYISDEQEEQAQGAASIEAHGVGEGQVILFMDNPNFRGFWYGTNGLFLNAVHFGQLLQ